MNSATDTLDAGAQRWLLPPWGRRLVLACHLLLVVGWMGGLLAVLALVAGKVPTAPIDYVTFDRAILLIHETLVVRCSYLVFFTGLAFSALTAYGFAQYRWVVVKWTGLMGLSVTLLLGAAPAVNTQAALSDVHGALAVALADYGIASRDVFFYTIAQLGTLIALVLLSVFKPWGRRATSVGGPRRGGVVVASLLVAVFAAAYFIAQYVLVTELRSTPVQAIDLASVPDGTFCGRARFGGHTYEVDVVVASGRITAVSERAPRSGLYARLAAGLTIKVLRSQRNDVDAVSGATTTSVALRAAIEDALRNGVAQQRGCSR